MSVETLVLWCAGGSPVTTITAPCDVQLRGFRPRVALLPCRRLLAQRSSRSSMFSSCSRLHARTAVSVIAMFE